MNWMKKEKKDKVNSFLLALPGILLVRLSLGQTQHRPWCWGEGRLCHLGGANWREAAPSLRPGKSSLPRWGAVCGRVWTLRPGFWQVPSMANISSWASSYSIACIIQAGACIIQGVRCPRDFLIFAPCGVHEHKITDTFFLFFGDEKCAARKWCWDEACLKICSPVFQWFQYTNVDVNVALCFQTLEPDSLLHYTNMK